MNCPDCSYPLIILEVEQIEVDHCLACKGVWLDAGELELVLEGAENRDRIMATLADCKEGTDKKVRCPMCNRHLDKVSYGDDKKVQLDKCPDGHGLWFEHGEIIDVMKMGQFNPDGPVYRLMHQIFGH